MLKGLTIRWGGCELGWEGGWGEVDGEGEVDDGGGGGGGGDREGGEGDGIKGLESISKIQSWEWYGLLAILNVW